MGHSGIIKKPGCKSYRKQKSSLESLPFELLTEILLKTTSSSFTSLFNAKLACKFLNNAANDNYVFKKISLEKFPLANWKKMSTVNEAASNSFKERCRASGNCDALFRQGVVDYFGLTGEAESGLEYLVQAANLGHYGALYTIAIIFLLSENDELKKKGVKFIGDLKKSKVTLKECREKLNFILKSMWLRHQIHWQRFTYCNMRGKHRRGLSGWERYKDDIQCDACQAEEEISFFLTFFPYV